MGGRDAGWKTSFTASPAVVIGDITKERSSIVPHHNTLTGTEGSTLDTTDTFLLGFVV